MTRHLRIVAAGVLLAWPAVTSEAAGAAGRSYGGTCQVGVTHSIAKDVYPRTIYFDGGAKCDSLGKPAVVFQDAQSYLWTAYNHATVSRGDRFRGYTDWSHSRGAYPGADKGQKYLVVVDVELQTPDGSNWANFAGDDCTGQGTPVMRCHVVGKTFTVS